MRRTVNSTFISLDGVQNHMEHWHFDLINDELADLALEQLRAADAMLMGRATYESYAAVWPERVGETYADVINAMPKYVASTSLEKPGWENTSVIEGDLVEAVRGLKERDGRDILMHGWGAVASTLLANGLLDVIHLWVHPVIAGVGGPGDWLFREGQRAKLALTDSRTLKTGVIVLSYAVLNDAT